MNLREILSDFIPQRKNEDVPVVDTILLLIYNLTIGKEPLYELENWVDSLHLKSINFEKYSTARFTDDRFGKALDKLYSVDRSTLMTKIVLSMVEAFSLELEECHNDSTTVKAYGKYDYKTQSGFELKKGKSK